MRSGRYLFVLISAFVVLTATSQPVTDGLSCRRFTTHDGLPQMQTERVWQDQRGYLYVGTLSGFARYDGTTMTPFVKGRGDNIVAFDETDGNVRALGFRRYWDVTYHAATVHPLDPHREWMLNNFNAVELPSGMILMENNEESNRRLCRFDRQGFTPLFSHPLLDRMTPACKLLVDSNEVYIPTDSGLYVARLNNDKAPVRQLSPRKDFFSVHRMRNECYAFAADGIYRIDKGTLQICCPCTFAAPDYGLSVCHDSHGRIFIADSHTLYCYDGRQVQILADGFNLIKHLFVDRWDRLWMATYQGLYCYFRMTFTNHRLTDVNDIVRALAVDGNGRLVMGTLNGKVIVDNEVISDEAEGYFQPCSAVVDGTVYLAGHRGVAKVGDHGLQWLELHEARCQFVAAAGTRVVIGIRKGVLAYDPSTGRIDTLSTDIAHPWCAAADSSGDIWVGSTYGLFHIRDHTVNQVDYPQQLIVTAMTADTYGNILFASHDSLFHIRGGQVSELNSRLPALGGHEIRSLHLSPRGYLTMATHDGLFVARTDGDMRIDSLLFVDQTCGFTILEPQKAVMAEKADGNVWLAGLEEMTSFSPAMLTAFGSTDTHIPPPRKWWQHVWVWVIAALLLAAVTWALARVYEARRNRKALLALKREKYQKELQITAIRLKSIPHFNSNVLSGIEYYVMNHSVEEATHYLKLYSDFTNSTLADIDRPARSVAEEVTYVSNYLALEKMRYGDALTYEVVIEEGVNRQTLLPTMLLHTYCQNAIKHGIAHKEGEGRVEIRIARRTNDEGEWVVVSVSDNGIGRKASARLNEHSTKKGLAILMEQIALHNQSNRRQITQTVTDLYGPDGQPAGTCYEMEIPTDYNYTDNQTT